MSLVLRTQNTTVFLVSRPCCVLDGHHPAELVLFLSRLHPPNPVVQGLAHRPRLVRPTVDANDLPKRGHGCKGWGAGTIGKKGRAFGISTLRQRFQNQRVYQQTP